MHALMYVHTYVRMHARMYVCMHECMHMCVRTSYLLLRYTKHHVQRFPPSLNMCDMNCSFSVKFPVLEGKYNLHHWPLKFTRKTSQFVCKVTIWQLMKHWAKYQSYGHRVTHVWLIGEVSVLSSTYRFNLIHGSNKKWYSFISGSQKAPLSFQNGTGTSSLFVLAIFDISGSASSGIS
jgi:hypothetical protein